MIVRLANSLPQQLEATRDCLDVRPASAARRCLFGQNCRDLNGWAVVVDVGVGIGFECNTDRVEARLVGLVGSCQLRDIQLPTWRLNYYFVSSHPSPRAVSKESSLTESIGAPGAVGSIYTCGDVSERCLLPPGDGTFPGWTCRAAAWPRAPFAAGFRPVWLARQK